MKRSRACSICHQIFSRKWNLERHLKLVHGQGGRPHNFETHLEDDVYGISRYDTSQKSYSSFDVKDYFAGLIDFTEMLNKMSNSSQTLGQLNSLRWQVGALQQQLSYCQSHLNDVYSDHWLIPRESIQGLSGFVCKNCQTFSLKPIFDIGYDMTMQSRHCCNESAARRNYFNFSFPSNGENTDEWAAQILFSHIKYVMPFGKFLYSKDLTKGFSDFSSVLSPDLIGQIVFGIPDRYQSYSLENNYDIDWIDRAINSLEKKIPIKDSEALDFLKRIKSTYAIFEIPVENTVKQVYIGFTSL